MWQHCRLASAKVLHAFSSVTGFHVLHSFAEPPVASQGPAALISVQMHVFLSAEKFGVVTAQDERCGWLQRAVELTRSGDASRKLPACICRQGTENLLAKVLEDFWQHHN